jgi:hypothetical protein
MIDIEALTQIINNINEAKEEKTIMIEERADIAEELIAIALDEEREIGEDLRDRLRHVLHELDVADETITASKRMLVAMIEEDDNEGATE